MKNFHPLGFMNLFSYFQRRCFNESNILFRHCHCFMRNFEHGTEPFKAGRFSRFPAVGAGEPIKRGIGFKKAVHYRSVPRGQVMRCERCNEVIAEGEERERYGQILCEDCYIDLLSQLKACDPWAVHSAKSFSKDESYAVHLNTTQQNILD